MNDRWCVNYTTKEKCCSEDIELVSVALRPFYLPRQFNQIFITVVYIHPRANCRIAVDKLSQVIHRLSALSPDAPSFILGDFNQCRIKNVLPTFYQYVTISTCGNNTLDLCYGNIKGAFKSHALPNLGRSIHNMVNLTPIYKQRLKQMKPNTRSVKVWSEEAVDTLNGCFDSTDWSVFLDSSNTLDEAVDVVSAYINFCVDQVVSSKEVKIYPNSKPWVTKELKEMMTARQAALKEGDREKMKQLQKKIDNKIKAKKRQYSAKLEDNIQQGNSRQSWQYMSTITGHKKKKGGIVTDSPETLANDLNTFYTRFDCHDFQAEQKLALTKVRELGGRPITVEEEDVRKLFSKLNMRSAAGPDEVSGKVLRLCCGSLAQVFTRLFQQSFNDCYVPRLWKLSTIVPVPKKKAPAVMNDYRPVALTSIPMKCVERIALKHLKQETAEHQDPLQFAYTQGRNTEDAILTLLHHLYQHLEKAKTYARILYVDFSSAFNTLQPHLLTEKLLAMDVNPMLIAWIQSFMTSRLQQVRIGSSLSATKETNTGAPQGCVLSPALFTTYTAECRAKNATSNIQIKFADDTSLTGLVSNADEASYREAVTELVEWCDENYLELNVTKTEEMVVDFRRNPGTIEPLIIKGKEVGIVCTYKYLGITIDNKLDWTAHVNACHKKANQRLFFLRKLRQFRVNSTILELFYRSVIESALLYNQLCFLNSAKQADRDRLERITTTAGKVIGHEVSSLHNIYEEMAVKKLRRILHDEAHPLHAIAAGHTSRRDPDRLLSMKSRTNRMRDSFLPTAIRLTNEAQNKT